ncbi:MAG: LacI family DNA-binding transcriptional regulator [Leifsonia sp.]
MTDARTRVGSTPAPASPSPGDGTLPEATDEPARVATMFDVAKLAGVSHQTVSRVLNDLPGVRASTRVRVEAAMAELAYTPSPAARTLASRRSQTIGLITAGRPDYGPSNAALGFNEAARAADFTVTQASMREVDAQSLRNAVAMMVRHNVSAIVLISGERAAIEATRSIRLDVPFVAFASEPVDGLHQVAMDQFDGARIAVEHLIALGHRRIRHVAGLADAMDAGERLRAWRETLQANGLPLSEPLVGTWTSESGYEAGRILARERDFTAVFVANDQMALGVLHAFRDAGIRVPEDVSVIGFDDIPEAAHFAPPLTTMRQDFDGLGRDIMATVLDVMGDEEHAPDRIARLPQLVVRGSTAPA